MDSNDTRPEHRRSRTTGEEYHGSVSNHSASSQRDNALGSNENPFDFDTDFEEIRKRRDRARAELTAKMEDERPILHDMDKEDDSRGLTAEEGAMHLNRARKPNIITRAKTAGVETKRTSFFGFGKAEEKEAGDYAEDMRQPVMVGKRKITVWPYDDYHLVQKVYYQKLQEKRSQKPQIETIREKEISKDSIETNIPVFSRPDDPPDITTAVQGLSLTEFERKAEERAIKIVSTWLFDVGLIDELLVNGGMTSVGPVDRDDQTTSEGIEVGQHGFPIEGSTKMDKEISKLKNATRRQLALINARLNDGVAATGAEVQELVNAVVATKDDIGRLRELSTYVSNHDDVDQANQFLLVRYPRLKQAMNARRNLARCFRELDFFNQIPSTCDRLREELHAGEWTAHEWSSLRDVCREHVELEIFLVEAEAGMKNLSVNDGVAGRRSGGRKFGRQALASVGLQSATDDLIDRFLEEHVENVWELGDEIRMRIMSGIAASFDLAMNNPAGMVALVEAVEVYQSANDEYKAVYGKEAGTGQTLRFTDMRAAALGELYKEFEARGLDVFQELTEEAADIAEEEEAKNEHFSAVLRAANELASEIGIVKEQMAPCFPQEWCIEILWVTGVAHLCSNNILQQIGGSEGHKLPYLSVPQLLDLVAWVENFREIIEESFPNINDITSTRTYLNKAPQLLVNNNKNVDIAAAKDSLAWVNKTLWEVHDLAKDEFLFRTKEQTEEWLNRVYDAEHTKNETSEGRLTTSLCEDVYALAGVQLNTIRERLTRRSEALVQATGVVFKNLYQKQILCREKFCTDLETCCAASNDFVRMSEKCEELVNDIQEECNLSAAASETLEEQAAALLGLYSGDAVYAAQKTHLYCFEPIEEAIGEEIFSSSWENELTDNENALTVVRTLDDFMEDLEVFLDEVMLQKTVEALIISSVNFYVKYLLKRASQHNSGRNSCFSDNKRAIDRMRGDLSVLQEYFDGLAESMPTLKRVSEKEFEFLGAILEMISIAAGISRSDAHDFILVFQKRIRNIHLTKYFVGDLYHLVAPSEERAIYEMIDGMEDELNTIAPTDEKAASSSQDRTAVPGLRIDRVIAEHIDECNRKRPLTAGTLERAEAALRVWRSNIAGKSGGGSENN